MAGDYIPHAENDLRLWASRFAGFVQAHSEEMGISPGELAEIQSANETFQEACLRHQEARSELGAAHAAKAGARKALLSRMRSLAMRARCSPHVEHSAKVAMDLGGGKWNGRSPLEESPDRPSAIIDIRQRLTHVLRIQNETTTGLSRARPQNATGCEVWRVIGDPGDGKTEMRFIGLATRSPFVVRLAEEDAGTKVSYRLRWTNRRGEKGSWSSTETATVAG
ncbi:MAG: hypothetical protein KBC96_15240 [Armatimonadetes bacterium]|nr:hypothetical protein [Armatimonadota bacterium]